MSSRHSDLITGTPSWLGAVDADCSVRRDSDAIPVARSRTRTRAPFQRRFRLTDQGQAHLENDIRLEERRRERTRIVHELHDTLLQGFLGASMLLEHAVEQTPADSPCKPALSCALSLVRRAIDEGRATMLGIHTTSPASSSLEEAFSELLGEVASGQGTQLRIFVQGRTRALNPVIQEQLILIGREAVMNALRHSEATKIEVEVHYLRDLLRVLVRDNGCGIEPEAVQKAGESHWGLRGMRGRADNIGARFDLRSRPGAGTEVGVTVPVDGAKPTAYDCGPWEGGSEICRTPVASGF